MVWWEYRGVGFHQLGEKTKTLRSGVGEILEGRDRALGKHLHLTLPFLLFPLKLLCGPLDTQPCFLRLLYMLHLTPGESMMDGRASLMRSLELRSVKQVSVVEYGRGIKPT